MAFTAKNVLPGVWHVQDCLGVCMTLLTGDKAALLVDTGYGAEDVQAYVRTLTNLPLTVILTHGHHDHALGAIHFAHTYMFPEDREDFRTYTGEQQRRRVIASMQARGLTVDEDAFLAAPIAMPEALTEHTIDLGGMTAQILHVPGHTPGSAVVWVPERKLLLTADDWNPCTWLFFPMALGMREYRANVLPLMDLPFEHVLCSHQPMLFGREKIAEFMAHLTDDNLRAAPAVDVPPYEDVDTHQADMGDGQIFVFDWRKAGLD